MAWLEVWTTVENLEKRGTLASVRGSLPNTQKNIWEMMVNPDMDVFPKAHRKIIRKTQKNNLLKTKNFQIRNISKVGVRFSHLACQRRNSLLCSQLVMAICTRPMPCWVRKLRVCIQHQYMRFGIESFLFSAYLPFFVAHHVCLANFIEICLQ